MDLRKGKKTLEDISKKNIIFQNCTNIQDMCFKYQSGIVKLVIF